MANFIYYTAVSLDGFIATEQDSLDWLLSSDVGSTPGRYEEFYAGVGCLVMGGTTYEWLLENLDEPWPYAGVPTWVFTHHELPALEGADITCVRGDVAEFIPDMVRDAAGKDVWVMGGGKLAAQFHQAGYLDELRLTMLSTVLGSGKNLLPLSGDPARFELSSAEKVKHGIELNYRRR